MSQTSAGQPTGGYNMTRAQMLLLSLLLMHLLLGVLCVMVSRSERRSAPLALWGKGLLVYAAGALVVIFGGILSVAAKQIIGNALISLAGVLTAAAIISYTRFRIGYLLPLSAWFAVVAVIGANHLLLAQPLYFLDVAMPTILSSILYMGAALLLLRDPPASATSAARFVSLMAVLAVLIWNLRMVAVWFSLGTANDPASADLAFSVFAIGQNLSLVATSLGLMWIEVRRMEADLQRTAVTDGLTGLLNRRGMSSRFEQVLSMARRESEPFSLLLFDLDHFKRVNDEYGHLAGDTVLHETARLLGDGKRNEDVLGRVGGEEFLLLLHDKDARKAREMAERLRKLVSGNVVDTTAGEVTVTVSAGIATFPGDGESWDRLFSAADRRLYLAKQQGRNRVVEADAVEVSNAREPKSERIKKDGC